MAMKTNRLIIRGFKYSDLDDFYEYASTKGVGEKAGWKPHTSKTVSKTILKQFIGNPEVFAIEERNSHKMIGSLGLHNKPFDDLDDSYRQRELGYILSKDYWNQGLMSEATKAIVHYAFRTMNLDRLSVAHFIDNKPSEAIIQKLGFTFVKYDTYYAKTLDKTLKEKKYILYNPRKKTLR
jgi:ribosomal-protein-alanine N-acetyltransferase